MADLYASDSRGIHIPQFFAESVRRECVQNVSDEDWAILEVGPDHEWYWEAWDNVTRDAKIVAPDGKTGFLYQDGDLWVVWGDNDPDYENLIGEAP